MLLQIIGLVALVAASYFAGKYGLLDVQVKRLWKWLVSLTKPKPVVVPETTQVDAKAVVKTTAKK